jgi:hypothetical protein
MVGDLPDYTRTINVYLTTELVSLMRSQPWWMRYKPKRTLYIDDFEGVLKWDPVVPNAEKISDLYAFEGSYALRLTTPNIAWNDAAAVLYLGLTETSKMAIELRWSPACANDQRLNMFWVALSRFDGVNKTLAVFQYFKNDTGIAQNKWQYFTAGADTDIPGGSQVILVSAKTKHFLRVVADFSAAIPEYVSLESDELLLDLRGTPLDISVDTTDPHIRVSLGIRTDVNAISQAYIDAFCLSDQEE